MKKQARSYLTFSRTERIGLFCLTGLLIAFISIRIAMPYFVHPLADKEQEARLMNAWEVFKSRQPKAPPDSASQKDYKDAFDESDTPLPNLIDINTADSATLVRLKGIGPVTAGKIIARRKNTGPFTSINQLSEVGSFSGATFELLKKHLVIGPVKGAN